MTLSISISRSFSVSLPDPVQLKALCDARVKALQEGLADTKEAFDARLEALKLTREDIKPLMDKSPKAVDAQLRGKLMTAQRFERELEVYSGAVAARDRLQAKIDAGQAASLFEVSGRQFGWTRTKDVITIVDSDLLLLQSLELFEEGLVGVSEGDPARDAEHDAAKAAERSAA